MFTREKKKRLTQLWFIGMLAVVLSIPFSACNIILFSSNCSGTNVSCNGHSTLLNPNPTVQAHAGATLAALTSKPPLASDPLTAQDGNQWGDDNFCYFDQGVYVVAAGEVNGGTWTCDSKQFYYGDVVIQMDVTLYSAQFAGIMFRADATMSEYYEFVVGDGTFGFAVEGKDNTFAQIISANTSENAVLAQGQTNRLTVIAKGNDFRLFINGTFVGETHDDTLTEGYIGMAMQFDPSGDAEFSHLVVYVD